jgi:hypothetical protein
MFQVIGDRRELDRTIGAKNLNTRAARRRLTKTTLGFFQTAQNRNFFRTCRLGGNQAIWRASCNMPVVTTPPPKPQKPQRVERDDTYVAYREYEKPAW